MRASSSGASRRWMARHSKLVGASGIALMAIGVWGMISVGSDTVQTIQQGDYSDEQSKTLQMGSYVFLFTLIGGLFLLIYAGVSSQAASASQRTVSR